MDNYEEKYKKVMQKLERILVKSSKGALHRKDIEEMFPELAESEAEKIRIALIDGVKAANARFSLFNEIPKDKFISWLEMQKEQKWSEEEEKMLQDAINCVNHIWADEEHNRLFCSKVLSNTIVDIENWLKSLRPQSKNDWSGKISSRETTGMLKKMLDNIDEEKLAMTKEKMLKESFDSELTAFEKEIDYCSKRFPEMSFAKMSRIAKRFYDLGKNSKDSQEFVSEDLEEASLLYYPKMSRISEPHGIIPADNQSHYLGDANEDNRKAFKAGAKWQLRKTRYEKDENNKK